jgi:hypothetical protein
MPSEPVKDREQGGRHDGMGISAFEGEGLHRKSVTFATFRRSVEDQLRPPDLGAWTVPGAAPEPR